MSPSQKQLIFSAITRLSLGCLIFALSFLLFQNTHADNNDSPSGTIDINTGLSTGGTTVTAAMSDFEFFVTPTAAEHYVQDGLLLHLDAIDNTATGDANHNNSATTWYDLTENQYNANLTNVTWNNQAAVFNGTNSSGIISENLELPETDTTIEVYGNTTQGTAYSIPFADKTGNHIMGYYYNSATNPEDPGGDPIITRGLLGTSCNTSNRAGFTIPDNIPAYDGINNFTVSRSYVNSNNLTMYINGTALERANFSNCWTNDATANYLGRRGGSGAPSSAFYYGTISSLRAYDRALSNLEVNWNNTVDKNRFENANITILNITSIRVGQTDIPFAIDQNDNLILTMPPHSPGTYDVVLSDGLANKIVLGTFTYNHTITEVTPSVGSTTGGNTITIKGTGFPENHNLVTDGLLLNLVGDNNTGNGYDQNATTWKDLSGNDYDAVLHNITWVNGGAVFNGLTNTNTSSYGVISRNLTLPQITTIEIVQNSTRTNGVIFADKTATHYFGYYHTNGGIIATAGSAATRTLFEVPLDLPAYNGTNIFTLSRRYTDTTNLALDINTIPLGNISATNYWTAPNVDNIIGQRRSSTGAVTTPYKGTIYAVRAYDRILTDNELLANFCQDAARYPNDIDIGDVNCGTDFVVEVNGQECLGVNRIDTETITCTAPASSISTETNPYQEGSVDVTVRINGVTQTLTDGYRYRAPMSITSLTPNNGSILGGTQVALNGHNFLPDGVSATEALSDLQIDFGTSSCTVSSAANYTNDLILCTTASHAAARVDVVVDNDIETRTWSASNPNQGGFLYSDLALSLSIINNEFSLPVNPNSQNQDYFTASVWTNNPVGYKLTITADDSSLVCDYNQNDIADPSDPLLPSVSTTGQLDWNQWGWAPSSTLVAGLPAIPSAWQPAPTGLGQVLANKFSASGANNDGTASDPYHLYFAAKANLQVLACDYVGTMHLSLVPNP